MKDSILTLSAIDRLVDSQIRGIASLSTSKDAGYEFWEIDFYYRGVANLLKVRFHDYLENADSASQLTAALCELFTATKIPDDVFEDYWERRGKRAYHALNGGSVQDIISGADTGVPMTYIIFDGNKRVEIPLSLAETLDYDEEYSSDIPLELSIYTGETIYRVEEYDYDCSQMLLGYNFEKSAFVDVDDFFRVWMYSSYSPDGIFGSTLAEELERYTDGRRVTEIHML